MTQFLYTNTDQAYDPLMHSAVFGIPYGQWETELTETLASQSAETLPIEPTGQSKRIGIIGPLAILALLVIGTMPLVFPGANTPAINVSNANTIDYPDSQQLVNQF